MAVGLDGILATGCEWLLARLILANSLLDCTIHGWLVSFLTNLCVLVSQALLVRSVQWCDIDLEVAKPFLSDANQIFCLFNALGFGGILAGRDRVLDRLVRLRLKLRPEKLIIGRSVTLKQRNYELDEPSAVGAEIVNVGRHRILDQNKTALTVDRGHV